MNLTDKEILELNDLCSAVIDETLDEKQKSRLSKWLIDSEDVRQFYIRAIGQSASLCYYAGEMHTEQPDAIPLPGKGSRRWKWVSVFLALAACALLTFTLANRNLKRDTTPIVQAPTDALAHVEETVAQLTGWKECEWMKGSSPLLPGAQLHQGQSIELAKGFAEITFDCGAQVILQGPASLDVNSAWSATLNRGTLKASVPPEAMGFSISNSKTVEVVDLGTEFTMFADASGSATDVMVLKGEVEASPNTPSDQQPVVLRENESRRFAATGISGTHADPQRFEALTQLSAMDHFVPPAHYAHWSFDQIDGNLVRGETSGLPVDASDLQLIGMPKAGVSSTQAKGRINGALRFSERMYAKASFPGISDNAPHTVVFWVKVPKDANLGNAYSMIAWGVHSPELGLHPIQVDWNRYPGEGTVGALRTDYGGGFAIGTTSLRDGRWHHVAVVFVPSEDPKSPMDVKQYVDGRFEGEGKPSPTGSDIFAYSPSESNSAPETIGTFWLGCRLGIKHVRADRFIGEMDELFIVDRALEPREIVELMSSNQLHFSR